MVGGSIAAVFLAVFLGLAISMIGSKKMSMVMWKPNKKEGLASLVKLFEAVKVVVLAT
jgi:hypothetical protein